MIKGDKRLVGLFLSGKPVLIKELNIALTPPKINDIVMFGEDDFLFATQLIVHTNEFIQQIKEGNSQLEIYSNFQLLMTIIRQDNTIEEIIINYLNFIFPDYKIVFKDTMIDFLIEIDEQEKIVGRINPFNYDFMKDMIENLFTAQSLEEEVEYNPVNDLAKQIADKIKEGRKKTKNLKAEQSKDQSMYAQIISALSIGLQMDVNIFYNYTPFQLYDTYKRFFLKQSYDLYQRISTMPFLDASKMEVPEDWTKYIY